MQYLTFADYKSMGGSLEQPEYTRAEYAARKEIDNLTFQRLQGIDPIPEDLKICVLELIERELCGNLDGQDFISQGSGKLSTTKESLKGKAAELIRKYLDGITVDGFPVFYAGNR
jgi:hypothetical protein